MCRKATTIINNQTNKNGAHVVHTKIKNKPIKLKFRFSWVRVWMLESEIRNKMESTYESS